jgi:capsule polysaccharide export protein KpsE/RkpR
LLTEHYCENSAPQLPAKIAGGASSVVQGRDLWGWLEVLWEERRRLLRSGLGGILLASLLGIALPPKYQATTRVLPSESSPSAMMMAGSGAALPNLGAMSELIGARTPGALFAAILRSDTVEDALINRFDLRKAYHLRGYETAREKLSNLTVISEDKKSGMVTVTVTDRDPQRVAGITNAYVEEADKVLQSLNTSAAHREREFLEKRIAGVRDGLLADEEKLTRFSSRNSALDLKEQGKAAFEMASRIQGEWIATQSELEAARQMYGPEHPQVRSLQAKAGALRASLGRMGAMPGAAAGESGLDYLALSRLPAVGASYADLFREVQLQESVYEALVKQYEISKVEEAKQTPRVRVIDAGKAPERRASPRLFMLFVLCTAAGLVGGVLAVMSGAAWRDSAPGSGWRRLGMRVAADLRRQAMGRATAAEPTKSRATGSGA